MAMHEVTSDALAGSVTPSVGKTKLLIVEDDESARIHMRWALGRDYEVFLAEDGTNAIRVFEREQPSVVTLDLGLPPRPRDVEEGFLALGAILDKDPRAKVVVITGRDEKQHALRAIGQGAYDFLCKPIELSELRVILRRAAEVHRLETEHRALVQRPGSWRPDEILGTSGAIQEVFAAIRKVATADVPVLIMGESGTGKELVARGIHHRSRVSGGPFVPINCAAIPESLLESELFGHEKGAFTGAHVQRIGRIQMASGGTLFLDEIGELSAPLQVKLLRYLQDQKIARVGGREDIVVNARVIAATHVDLKAAMRDRRFREDLFYRLGVLIIHIPPLRDREEDVLVIARALLQKYAAEFGRKIVGFERSALEALRTHGWPGNVRELENRIKRAVIMAEGRQIAAADLQLDSPLDTYNGKPLREACQALEREIIKKALAKTAGNITRAATELGISRPTLYDLIGKHAISTSSSQ
jgi:two-component system NtrC family response regulator